MSDSTMYDWYMSKSIHYKTVKINKIVESFVKREESLEFLKLKIKSDHDTTSWLDISVFEARAIARILARVN